MATSELKRIPMKEALELEPEAVMAETVKLAKDASLVLGYNTYSNHLNAAEKERLAVCARNKIVKALAEEGIELIDGDSAKAYMAKQQKEVQGTSKRRWAWKRNPLRGFTGIVPDFAVSLALSVHGIVTKLGYEAPNYQVLTLEQEAVQKVHPDPFLFFSVKEAGVDNNFCLAAWDEPKFEGRQTV